MSGHTKGPWAFARYSKKRFGIGQAGEGAFFMLECVNDDTENPQAIADARLMRASPDLLEALERLSAQCTRLRLPGQAVTDAEKAALAAIEKATGKP